MRVTPLADFFGRLAAIAPMVPVAIWLLGWPLALLFWLPVSFVLSYVLTAQTRRRRLRRTRANIARLERELGIVDPLAELREMTEDRLRRADRIWPADYSRVIRQRGRADNDRRAPVDDGPPMGSMS